jgi:Ca2+-binding RTX toxin-like protein
MRPWKTIALTGAVTIVLAGCIGDTTDATDVRSTQAQLNARGHTNNGPAYWWWEYGTTRAAVKAGTGTKTPRQGPAASPTDVNVNTVVKNLAPSQAYYFRACGQDQAAGSAAFCGNVHTFTTAPGDSKIETRTGTTPGLYYTGSTTTAHQLTVSTGDVAGGVVHVDLQEAEDTTKNPEVGSVLVAGTGCTASISTTLRASYADHGDCAVSTSSPELYMTTGPYDDVLDLIYVGSPTYVSLGAGNDGVSGGSGGNIIFGEAGNDNLAGGRGNDTIIGGPGNDTIYGLVDPVGGGDQLDGGDGDDTIYGSYGNDFIFGRGGNDTLIGEDDNDTIYGSTGDDAINGGAGDDVIYGGAGVNRYDCGPGNDLLHVNSYDEWGFRSTNCEAYVIDGGGA